MAKHRVTYSGPGTRIISKADWASLGVDHPQTKWVSLVHGHTPSIEVEDISDAMVEYLTKTDRTGPGGTSAFTVEEITEEPKSAGAPDEDEAALAAAAEAAEGEPEVPSGTKAGAAAGGTVSTTGAAPRGGRSR